MTETRQRAALSEDGQTSDHGANNDHGTNQEDERQSLLSQEQGGGLEKQSELSEKDASERSIWERIPVINEVHRLYTKYDPTFLTMLGMQYFN